MRAVPIDRLRGLGGYDGQKVPSTDLLRLDGSEGTRPTEVFDGASTDWADLARRYPHGSELAGELAERIGVSSERIVLGAGADERDEGHRQDLLTGAEVWATNESYNFPAFKSIDIVSGRNSCFRENANRGLIPGVRKASW